MMVTLVQLLWLVIPEKLGQKDPLDPLDLLEPLALLVYPE